jgi:hypothetical protein
MPLHYEAGIHCAQYLKENFEDKDELSVLALNAGNTITNKVSATHNRLCFLSRQRSKYTGRSK